MWVVTVIPSGRSEQRLVDVPDVGLVQVLGVLALAGHLLALARIVEVGEAGVVELEVLAAERRDRP